MRIGFYMANFHGGGAEKSLINLANALCEKIDVYFIVLNSSGPRKNELGDRVQLHVLGGTRERYGFLRLSKKIKELKLDACISTMIGSNICLGLAKFFLPKSTLVLLRESNYRKYENNLKSLLLKVAYCKADVVVANSKGIRENLKNQFGVKDALVIYNPIDISKIQSMAADKSNPALALLERAKENQKFVIVASGRLEDQKGFDILIKSIGQIKSNRTLKVFILGEGSQRKALEDLIVFNGLEESVELIGYQDNPYPLYKAADLFILSSRWEGFGHVIAEALSLGTPVLSSDCKSGPSEILGPQLERFLFKSDDAVALEEKLSWYLDNRYNEKDVLAGVDCVRRFDSAAIAQSYLDALFPGSKA